MDLAVDKMAPVSGEMTRLMNDPGHIDSVLKEGADRAREIAAPIYADVKKIIGFIA